MTETAWDTDTEGPATSNGHRSRWSWRDARGREWGFGESARIPGRWGLLRALGSCRVAVWAGVWARVWGLWSGSWSGPGSGDWGPWSGIRGLGQALRSGPGSWLGSEVRAGPGDGTEGVESFPPGTSVAFQHLPCPTPYPGLQPWALAAERQFIFLLSCN